MTRPRNGKPTRRKRWQQRRAYELRSEGLTWAAVAHNLAVSSASRACRLAKAHSKREGLEWPVPLPRPNNER